MLSEQQVKLDLFHVLYIGLIVDFFLLIKGMQFVFSYYTVHLYSNSEYCMRNCWNLESYEMHPVIF